MRRRAIEAVLNEILGLHNKPKAAVQSVHKLTGPKKKNTRCVLPCGGAVLMNIVICLPMKYHYLRFSCEVYPLCLQ